MGGSTSADLHHSYLLRAPTAEQHQQREPEPAGPPSGPRWQTEPGSTAGAPPDSEPLEVTVQANTSTRSRGQVVPEPRQPHGHILSTKDAQGLTLPQGEVRHG